MARKTNRVRKKTPKRSVGSTLAWTAVLSLVFSAGLITGQRMLRAGATPPLLASAGAPADAPDDAPDDAPKAPPLSFSFYEKLGDDGAKGAESRAPNQGIQDTLEQARKGEPEANGELPARYTLQVGAHPAMHKAKGQMGKLRDKGLEPHMVSIEKGDGGKLYRVRVGKFHSMDEARHFQAEIKRSRDVDTFVTPL
jgi:cell division protein FtsN